MTSIDRRASRLDGHALVARGAPHGKNGLPTPRRRYWHGTGGRGRALCTCGTTSPILSSVEERIAWHREHKDELRSQP